MDQVNDKWIRIGGVLLLLLNLFITDRGGDPRAWKAEVFYIVLYILVVGALLEGGRAIVLSMHKKYPSFAQSRKRFWQTWIFVSLSNACLIPILFNVFHWLRGMHAGNSPAFFVASAFGGMLLAFLQTGIYEGFYNFSRLKKLELEREELLRSNIQSQFDSLKQQVNPHFLFNSINTVSSLISIDPVSAQKFLAEMSKVYRYLLKANEQELTTVERELEFLYAYFHLLKTRFGDGLKLILFVNEESRKQLLPVLTLQLLIENAVKHNSVSSEQPLSITIQSVDGHNLIVKNNLQKKVNVFESNKMGLNNIISKYKLLKQETPTIMDTEEEFIVILPLIQTTLYEHTNC